MGFYRTIIGATITGLGGNISYGTGGGAIIIPAIPIGDWWYNYIRKYYKKIIETQNFILNYN